MTTADSYRKIRDFSDDFRLTAMLSQFPAIVVAAADQNLFRNDPIHFELKPWPDAPVFQNGEEIASITVPANPNIDTRFIVGRLEALVTQAAEENHMPPWFSSRVGVSTSNVPFETMQADLREGNGRYVLTARAASDVYPHTGGVPVALSFVKR
ncbi:MAG: hypothetical protein JOZ38_08040 [Candidatus Eremiobacteraeota bacterium]|nr:hypothetical protein [Candidatus Eremiobacteraeota bacterium]